MWMVVWRRYQRRRRGRYRGARRDVVTVDKVGFCGEDDQKAVG